MSRVEIYTKSWCGFCHRAKHLLDSKGVDYEEIPVDDGARIDEMVDRAGGGRTVPQIFIGGKHIGGSDALMKLERDGELDGLLAA